MPRLVTDAPTEWGGYRKNVFRCSYGTRLARPPSETLLPCLSESICKCYLLALPNPAAGVPDKQKSSLAVTRQVVSCDPT